MLALVRDGRNDPPVTLQEVPEPQPKEGEALVQVRASSGNFCGPKTTRTTIKTTII